MNIEKLLLVVQNPLYELKYYHGDFQADLIAVLESYNDSDELASELGCAEDTIEQLNDEIAELEKQIEALKA